MDKEKVGLIEIDRFAQIMSVLSAEAIDNIWSHLDLEGRVKFLQILERFRELGGYECGRSLDEIIKLSKNKKQTSKEVIH